MSLGSRIKEERSRLCLTQPAFGVVAQASTRSVASWEADESQPTATALKHMALSGVDVSYILTGARSPQRPNTSDRIFAGGGLKLDQDGELVRASRDEIISTFLKGRNPDIVKEFLDEISHSPAILIGDMALGKALSIIDQYGVRAADLYDFMVFFAADGAREISNQAQDK